MFTKCLYLFLECYEKYELWKFRKLFFETVVIVFDVASLERIFSIFMHPSYFFFKIARNFRKCLESWIKEFGNKEILLFTYFLWIFYAKSSETWKIKIYFRQKSFHRKTSLFLSIFWNVWTIVFFSKSWFKNANQCLTKTIELEGTIQIFGDLGWIPLT